MVVAVQAPAISQAARATREQNHDNSHSQSCLALACDKLGTPEDRPALGSLREAPRFQATIEQLIPIRRHGLGGRRRTGVSVPAQRLC